MKPFKFRIIDKTVKGAFADLLIYGHDLKHAIGRLKKMCGDVTFITEKDLTKA